MRLFFIFLLIVNILMGVWFYMQPVKNDFNTKPMSEGIQSLVLLDEVGASDEVEPVIPEFDVASVPKETGIDANALAVRCYTLGPFRSEKSAKKAIGKMGEQIKDANIRSREESQERYWVYLPATKTRALAKEKTKELTRAKISDFYILNNSEKKNSISLGQFKEKQRAINRRERIKKDGFDVHMNP